MSFQGRKQQYCWDIRGADQSEEICFFLRLCPMSRAKQREKHCSVRRPWGSVPGIFFWQNGTKMMHSGRILNTKCYTNAIPWSSMQVNNIKQKVTWKTFWTYTRNYSVVIIVGLSINTALLRLILNHLQCGPGTVSKRGQSRLLSKTTSEVCILSGVYV